MIIHCRFIAIYSWAMCHVLIVTVVVEGICLAYILTCTLLWLNTVAHSFGEGV